MRPPLTKSSVVLQRVRLSLASLAFTALGFGWTCASIATFETTGRALHADAAIVLGAALWQGKPSPVLAARIDHGVQLLKTGTVRWLIFTGGKASAQPVSEADAASQYATAHGASASRILLETRSTSTPENLCYALMVGTQHGLQSYIVISDPYHLKRAMSIADRIGMNALPSATPTTRYISVAPKAAFLLREAFYLTKYRLSWPRRC